MLHGTALLVTLKPDGTAKLRSEITERTEAEINAYVR